MSNETVHKTSVPVPQRTQSIPNLKTNQLMPLGKVTAIYSENNKKYVKSTVLIKFTLLNVLVDGAYSYHWALKGKFAVLLTHE